MKPPPFEYHRPRSREEVDALLAEHGGDSKLLAGGQSLVPLLNMRLVAPGHVIDLSGLEGEPAEPELNGGEVVMGPLVRHAAVERSALVAEHAPLVAETMRFVAHPAIRSRGTFAGAVAHADPASEVPPLLLVLGASVRARSARGSRTIEAADLFVGPLETSLDEHEWIETVHLPAGGLPGAVEEFARRHGDYALCGVLAVAQPRANGASSVLMSYLGVGDQPVLIELQPLPAGAGEAEVDALVGDAADTQLDPQDDVHASAELRAHLARRLGARAAQRALSLPTPGG